MKKSLLLILLVFTVIIVIIGVNIYSFNRISAEAKKFNSEYEKYNKKDILGVDLITAINKAVNNNEKYEIKKDERNRYINDNKYSIQIQIKMLMNDKTYDMEQIYNLGSDKFITNFGSVAFNCVDVEYHKETGRISIMRFESVE